MMDDWKSLYARLLETERLLGSLKRPINYRLAGGFDTQRKEYARQIDGIVDQLVLDVRKRVSTTFFVGGGAALTRSLRCLEKTGITTIDAGAPYYFLAGEVATRSGVAKLVDGKLVGIPSTGRVQFTIDMLQWIQGVTLAKYMAPESGSYYGRQMALASTLSNPSSDLSPEARFADLGELVAIVRGQFRISNRAEEVARCGVQDTLRKLVHQESFMANPILAIYGVDSIEEAHGIAGLFSVPSHALDVSALNDKAIRDHFSNHSPNSKNTKKE